MSRNWTHDEVKNTVKDYFDMLISEINGIEYNKASHTKNLIDKLNNRSKPSIEFKRANISACLAEKGYRYIDGYKPRGNYQKLISKVIEDYLAEHSDIGEVIKSNGTLDNIIENQVEVKYALRDEIANVYAMAHGGLSAKYHYQILLCKKEPFREDKNDAYLLDAKVSQPAYELSVEGNRYITSINEKPFNLEYIAYKDSFIKIPIYQELFTTLQKEGFFPLWHPDSPMKYFAECHEGYLTLFRVYKITQTVNEALLKKGRSGRNFYFGLSEPITVEVIEPVINEDDFQAMKQELIGLLKQNNWMIDVKHSDYNEPIITEYTDADIVKGEERAYKENNHLSLDEIAEKIKNKGVRKRQINVMTNQYYRDPDVVSYAKKRANGVCECCGQTAPFEKDDGEPFLEVHHLVALGHDGEDVIGNVCAVCPNCHRQMHLGKERLELTKRVIDKLKEMDK